VHLIWGTHNHERILKSKSRIKIFDHLLQKSKENNIIFEGMNIQPEHVHILLTLPSDKTIAKVAKDLKGESSNWINENKLIPGKFRWQRGYGAFSVSASQFDIVKKYIKNQEEHHRRKSFKEEYDEWAIQYGILDN
jgi:REP element-mobilizing transposase RayT